MGRTRVRYQRIGRGIDVNVKEIFPSASGGKRVKDSTVGRASAEDREPRAIRCYQCGQPIEDYAAYSTCPLCGSDNMLGRRF